MDSSLLFRHMIKQYSNGKSKTFKLDPDILNVEPDLRNKLFKLIKKFNIPVKIVTSPFRRCQTTARVIKAELSELGFDISIEIDRNWGEFLGYQSKIDFHKDFTKETSKHNPIIETSYQEFQERVKSINPEPGVWYITHGIVIQQLEFLIGKKVKISEHFKSYEYRK